MKILIVNNMAPFVWGGAEELAVNLEKQLIISGYQAEILRIPFQWEPATRIPSQMLMVRALELINVDRVIALKFPAYLIRHPHKTLWILHQYRQAYDLYQSANTNLTAGQNGTEISQVIKNADEEAFRESRKIYTNSTVTQQRLSFYNHFDSEVLLPPLNDEELFTGGVSQGYIFAGGRINQMKRQHLLVKAMAFVPSQVKLVIAGPPDSPEDADYLRQLVESQGLTQRIKLDLRFLSRSEIAGYVNQALCCAYLPYDEDSLGYVSMEAAAARKALITAADSGGILQLVQPGQTGWVAEPDPKAIADVLTEATFHSKRTEDLGFSARRLWSSMEINWPQTIARLLK